MRVRILGKLAIAALAVVCGASTTMGQERDRYILGEQKQLEILVHILGQVQKPGEYRVPDGTNVLELLSKAGGPTEYSDLSEVVVTHALPVDPAHVQAPQGSVAGPRVLRVDLKSFLQKPDPPAVPVLHPGDVVSISTNSRYTWKLVSGILRDLAVVASAYFLGVRAFKD